MQQFHLNVRAPLFVWSYLPREMNTHYTYTRINSRFARFTDERLVRVYCQLIRMGLRSSIVLVLCYSYSRASLWALELGSMKYLAALTRILAHLINIFHSGARILDTAATI